MYLNEVDFKLILKQENVHFLVQKILKDDYDGNLFFYIKQHNLYDKVGIPQNELRMYNIETAQEIIRMYILKPENEELKKSYDFFIKITDNPNTLISTIGLFYKTGREIPKDLLNSFLNKTKFYAWNSLLQMIIYGNVVPPEELLEAVLLKDEKIIKDIIEQLNFQKKMGEISGNKHSIHASEKTLDLIEQLKKKNRITQESFKLYFQKQ
jgi:hypothetical protein